MDSRARLHSVRVAAINYEQKKAELKRTWQGGSGQLRLAKSTISNLFRYQPRGVPVRKLSLGHFNEVIGLDAEQRTLEVEGLTTYETAVRYALARGFLPLVAPELKHITVGGATVGIGIESTCFRHGFVHDGLIEADVLLPDGRIVTCSASNEHADLFRALPNSYGTLGYILRAKIAVHEAAPYVHIAVRRFDDLERYLDALEAETRVTENDFVEGLVFEDGRYLTMTGRFRDRVPHVDDILRREIFYKIVQQRDDVYLATQDYIFRYDPEWFWNIPENAVFDMFRRYAPAGSRNSSFYTKYVALKAKLRQRLPGAAEPATEPLIQDWQVPWSKAKGLLAFAIENVPLDGRPWAAVPIKTPSRPTLYPIEPETLYFNLGCYLQVRKPPGYEPYTYTKIMDRKCFELGGIKMLYSSSFLGPEEFDARFNGEAYRALKQKYDPDGHAPTLYEKVAFKASREA